MNITSLHIKIDPKLKREAQQVAEDLGFSLSAVTKALLKQFIRTKQLSVGNAALPEIPNARTQKLLKQSEEDFKAGRYRSFNSGQEAADYVRSLIKDEKYKHRQKTR